MTFTEDGNSTQHSGLVFHVLVSIISSLEDPKFEQFKPVLDAYISHHFAAALVYKVVRFYNSVLILYMRFFKYLKKYPFNLISNSGQAGKVKVGFYF